MACPPWLQRVEDDRRSRLMGVLFDPEALVARLKGGEAEEALLMQPEGELSPTLPAHRIT